MAKSGPQNSPGVPPGTKFYSPFPFAGMNTQASPVAVSDQEFLWVENFLRLGDGKFRTAYDAGSPLYEAPGNQTIVFHFAFSIKEALHFAVFLSDGSAVQVTWPSGAVTQIGPAGKFYDPAIGSLPGCAQWGVQYLLIGNRNTVDDYWIWDGSLLYQTGSVAPAGVNLLGGGSNYNIEPSMNVFGGHGTGVQLASTINAGSVVNVAITDPGSGYEEGDIPQIQFTGGGSDNGVILRAELNAGGVAAANITNPGSGYTSATAAFSGGGGTGATGTVQIGEGVASVAVTNAGSGYTFVNISFTGGGGGSGATAEATLVGGQIASIDVITPGAGYTSAPTVVIGGDGASGAATATVDAGQVIGITITSPGTGYTSAPAITITGDGTGATAVGILGSSSVKDVLVIDPGTGFVLQLALTFQGGGGTGASAYTLLAPPGLGSVARIDVLSAGENYQQTPTTKLLGGPAGVGQAGFVTIMNGSGGVGHIDVFNGGLGYAVPPGVIIVPQKNDTGTGATARAVLSPHALDRVVMMNYGLHYTDAPTVIAQPGANNAAYATIALMPFGLSGSIIETFQQRVWLAFGAQSPFTTLPPQGNFAVTAPGSLTDVATSDGGVLFTNSDGFLQTKYVAIKQSNGYLYFVGDGSCSVVSGVETGGNPTTTTFNYQTVDPQVGCSWVHAVEDFGRNIIIANEVGIFSIMGGGASKISDKVDGTFTTMAFPPAVGVLTPTAAVAHLFNIKHYLFLCTLQDPDTFEMRNVMLTWNGRDWSVTSQSPDLIAIGTQKRGSQLFAWGHDGKKLYPLFDQPSATLEKRIDTKLYGANSPIVVKELLSIYLQAQDQSATLDGVAAEMEFAVSGVALQADDLESVPTQVYTQAEFAAVLGNDLLVQNPDFQAPEPGWPVFGTAAGGVPALNIGARITTKSPDFILAHLLLAYRETLALL